jgi:hypothetical protein
MTAYSDNKQTKGLTAWFFMHQDHPSNNLNTMKYITILLLFLFTAVSAHAQVIVSDTFAGETPGATLPGTTTTTGGGTWVTDDGTNQSPVFVDLGGGDIAIEWTKKAGTREHAFDMPSMTQGIYSVDINFKQDGLHTDGKTKDAITFRVASTLNMAAGTNTGFFVDRSLQGFALDSWHTVTMIFNGEASPLSYDTTGLTDTGALGSLGTVAAETAHLFVDGNLFKIDQAAVAQD